MSNEPTFTGKFTHRGEPIYSPAGPAGARCAVPTGSLPAASVNSLLSHWETELRRLRALAREELNEDIVADYLVALRQWERCIEDLRAEMARANLRQPEENNRDEARG